MNVQTDTTTTHDPAPQPSAPASTGPTAGSPAKTDGPAGPAADPANPAPAAPAATDPAKPAEGGDKPFLGNPPADPAKPGDPEKPADPEKPGAPDEKAYLDAIRKDEAIFGKDDRLGFDQRLVKAVIPVCQKFGVSTEAANAMANAFAKAQLDGARAAFKQRADYFQKMNGEARAKYSDADFAQINRGIDAHFRPGGVMNAVVRNSELGSDPEFLALMHRLGAAVKEDAGKGAAAGGDGSAGQAAGFAGIAAAWK